MSETEVIYREQLGTNLDLMHRIEMLKRGEAEQGLDEQQLGQRVDTYLKQLRSEFTEAQVQERMQRMVPEQLRVRVGIQSELDALRAKQQS